MRRGYGNPGSLRNRITVCPGTDARKCDRRDAVLGGKSQRRSITRCEQLGFAATATVPDGPHSMNDEPGGQSMAMGDLRRTGRAAAKAPALFQETGSGCPVNRAIDTTTAEQRSVGRIDDRAHGQRRNVGLQCDEFCR